MEKNGGRIGRGSDGGEKGDEHSSLGVFGVICFCTKVCGYYRAESAKSHNSSKIIKTLSHFLFTRWSS